MAHQDEPPAECPTFTMTPTSPSIGVVTYNITAPGVSGAVTIDSHSTRHRSLLALRSGRFTHHTTPSLPYLDLLNVSGFYLLCAVHIDQREPFPVRLPIVGLNTEFQRAPLPLHTRQYAESVLYTVVHHWRRTQASQRTRHTVTALSRSPVDHRHPRRPRSRDACERTRPASDT